MERAQERLSPGIFAVYGLAAATAVFAYMLVVREPLRVLMFGGPSLLSALGTAFAAIAVLTWGGLYHAERVYGVTFIDIGLNTGFNMFMALLTAVLGMWGLHSAEGLIFIGLAWVGIGSAVLFTLASFVWLVRRTSLSLGLLLFLTTTLWVALLSIVLVLLFSGSKKKAS